MIYILTSNRITQSAGLFPKNVFGILVLKEHLNMKQIYELIENGRFGKTVELSSSDGISFIWKQMNMFKLY